MKGIIKISILVFVVFFTSHVQAQQCGVSNRSSGFHILEILQKHIELSEDQSASIKEILSSQKAKIAELKNNFAENESKENFRSAIEKIKNDTNTAITKILNDEQVVVYEQIKTERKDRGGKHFSKGKDCRADNNKVDRAEMKAKFLEMRVQLNEVISRKDKKKIKSLSKTMRAAKAEKEAFFLEMKAKEAMPSKEEMRSAFSTWEKKYEKEMEAIHILVEKYDADIKVIFDNNDISKAGKKSCSAKGKKGDNNSSCSIVDKKNCCTTEANTPNCCKGKIGKKDKMKVRFLLMDPKGVGEDVSKVDAEEVEVSTVQISPNPVKAKATIAYEVKNEGNIKIDIIDESGNFVKNLLNKNKKVGSYQLNFNTNTLQSNNKIYFVVITDAIGINNEKLLINK